MAQNTLEIIIKANAGKAQAELKALDKTIGQFGATTGKGFDTLKAKWAAFDAKLSSPEGMKAMIGTAGAVVGALVGVGLAIKGLADDYMNYAFQVKDFGRIIGATPEEASKLIQVADDVRLSVGSMTTALRSAITKGYAPSIEGLGQLADKYLAIQDPIERSRFLVETFGRSGLEMAKLMELGSAKIKEMGDSIEGTGRLMTEEGIAKAQAYYEALDRIGDSAESAKMSLASALFPAIVDVAEETANLTESGLEWLPVFSAMQKSMESGAKDAWDVQAALIAYITNAKDLNQILDDFTDKTAESSAQLLVEGRALMVVKESSKSSADALREMSEVQDEAAKAAEDHANALEKARGTALQSGLSGTLTKEMEDYQKTLSELLPEQEKLQKRLNYLNVSGWIPSAESVRKFAAELQAKNKNLKDGEAIEQANIQLLASHNQQLKNTKAALSENEEAQLAAKDAMLQATEAMIYQQAAAGLDATASLSLARAMGMISEQDYAVSSVLQNLKLQFDANADGAIVAGEGALQYAGNVLQVSKAVEMLQQKNLPVTIDNIAKALNDLNGVEQYDPSLSIPDPETFNTVESAVLNFKDSTLTAFSEVTTQAGITAEGTKQSFEAVDWYGVGSKIGMDISGGVTGSTLIKDTQTLVTLFKDTWAKYVNWAGVGADIIAMISRGVINNIPILTAAVTKAMDAAIGSVNIPSTGNSSSGNPSAGNTLIPEAMGGPVMPYQSYLVGERGPELFIPNMAGRIVNSQQTSQITNQPTTITNTFILPQQTNVRELARLVYKEQQRAGVT